MSFRAFHWMPKLAFPALSPRFPRAFPALSLRFYISNFAATCSYVIETRFGFYSDIKAVIFQSYYCPAVFLRFLYNSFTILVTNYVIVDVAILKLYKNSGFFVSAHAL